MPAARAYLERWVDENNDSGRAGVNCPATHDAANLCDYIDAALAAYKAGKESNAG
jgi:hypothetical protein